MTKNVSTKSKFELLSPPLFEYLLEKNSEFVGVIQQIAKDCEPVLNKVGEVFPQYTLHDMDHSVRILNYIGDALSSYEALSDLEIASLILATILHDVGMFVTEAEVVKIKEGKLTYGGIKYPKLLEMFGGDQNAAVQDLVRKFHGKRSYDFVLCHYSSILTIPSQPSISFAEDIALICQSHTLEFAWLVNKLKTKKMLGEYKYNPAFVAILLRLGDVLDFDSLRTPLFLYKLINPAGASKKEWQKHFEITNNKKIQIEPATGIKSVVFYGQCEEPYIHRMILRYFDWINKEIYNSITITSKYDKEYRLKIKYPLENYVEPKGYTISDLKLTIDYIAITNLLMGENIYGSKRYGLRELVQNAMDTCALRREMENSSKEPWDESYVPRISIVIDEEYVIVRDNGVGMSMEVIKDFFLNVGRSYYQSDEFKLHGYDYPPIGKFGIGFLSCFMLSKSVKVKTRHIESSKCYYLDLVKDSEYICINEVEDMSFTGTEIWLNHDEVLHAFDNKASLITDFVSSSILTENSDFKIVNKIDNIITPIATTLKGVEKKVGLEIDLSQYLLGIEGYVYVTYSNNIESNIFDEIKIVGTPYVYTLDENDNYVLVEVDVEGLDPNNYYIDGFITTLVIPIVNIEVAGKFNQAMELLNDDIADVVSRLDDDLDYITVFVHKENVEDVYVKDGQSIGHNDDIVYDVFKFDMLEEIGQCIYCQTMVNVRKHNVITLGKDFTYNLHYKEKEKTSFWRSINTNKRIYLRNVYITGFSLEEHFSQISGFKINSAIINISNNEAEVNISRGGFSEACLKNLLYAVQKALYLHILHNFLDDNQERAVFKIFMEKFFTETNLYLKSNSTC